MPFIKESFQIHAPQRVIAFLRQILRISMKDAQRFVDKGRVEQNGEVVRDKTRVLQGEVSVSHFKAVDLGIAPIFENADFAAFDKPAGLLSHPKGRFWHFSLLDAVRFHFGGGANLINRLDYETSGLVLASKNKKSEAELKALFENRAMEKTYLALVEGKVDSADLQNLGEKIQFKKPYKSFCSVWLLPKVESHLSLNFNLPNNADFVIDLPIKEGKMGSDLGIRSRVCEGGKPAQTAVKILHYDCRKNQTLLKVTPLTGRTHQIRVHLAHIGHKIVGDGLYGVSDAKAREFLAQKAQNLDSANKNKKPCHSERSEESQNKNPPLRADSQNLHNPRCYNAIKSAESSAKSRLMLHAQSLRFCYKNKDYFIYAPTARSF